MKNLIYYILAAIMGGIIKEINEDDEIHFRKLFINGATGIVIGTVFGLLVEHISKSIEIAVAISALMGVWGFSSLTWLRKNLKSKVDKKSKK